MYHAFHSYSDYFGMHMLIQLISLLLLQVVVHEARIQDRNDDSGYFSHLLDVRLSKYTSFELNRLLIHHWHAREAVIKVTALLWSTRERPDVFFTTPETRV